MWQKGGVEALNLNASHLTDLFPEWLHLSRTGGALDFKDWDPNVNLMNTHVVDVARDHHVAIQPVFNNAEGGQFDSVRAHAAADLARQAGGGGARRRGLAAGSRSFQGLNLDFENLTDADYRRLPDVRRAAAATRCIRPVFSSAWTSRSAGRTCRWRSWPTWRTSSS